MDHASVLQWMASGIPFNKHLGLELLTVEDGVGRVRLKEAPHLLNHVGTQHAAALFAAGDEQKAVQNRAGSEGALRQRECRVFVELHCGREQALRALAGELLDRHHWLLQHVGLRAK